MLEGPGRFGDKRGYHPVMDPIQKCEALLAAGDNDTARRHLERLLLVDWDSADDWVRLSHLCNQLSLTSSEQTCLRRALLCNPLHEHACALYGHSCFLNADYKCAAEYLQRSMSVHQSASRLVVLAAAFSALGRIEDERRSLEQALRLEPNNVEAGVALGEHLLLRGDERAEEVLRHALQCDNANARAWFHLGQVLCGDVARLPEATHALERAVHLDPGLYMARLQLARLAWQCEDIETAEDMFARVANDADAPAIGCLLYAQFLAANGDLNTALAWADRGVCREPENGQLWLMSAELYRSAGNDKEAQDCISRALLLDPGDERALTMRG